MAQPEIVVLLYWKINLQDGLVVQDFRIEAGSAMRKSGVLFTGLAEENIAYLT